MLINKRNLFKIDFYLLLKNGRYNLFVKKIELTPLDTDDSIVLSNIVITKTNVDLLYAFTTDAKKINQIRKDKIKEEAQKK